MDQRTERFAGWMKEHLGVLHRISRAYADAADQHDLLQELMISVWKAAPAFRAESAPKTFIYRVGLNRALSWRKRESGRSRRSAELDFEWQAIAASDSDPAEAALLERLYAGIRKLRAADRALILLSLDGLPQREIARIHGLTETNVGVRLSRIRRQISVLMQEQDDGF
jgi:RNA polymerase sigma-70 factor (ECF subfamily)